MQELKINKYNDQTVVQEFEGFEIEFINYEICKGINVRTCINFGFDFAGVQIETLI